MENRVNFTKNEKIFGIFVVLIMFLACIPSVIAAEVKGEIFDLSFEQATNVIVSINSTPKQQMISKDGEFSFNIPKGIYLIEAKLYENNILIAESSEEIILGTNDGAYVLDMILFPALSDSEVLFESDDIDLDVGGFAQNNDTLYEEEKMTDRSLFYFIVIVAALIIVLALVIFIWKYILSKMIRRVEEDILKERINASGDNDYDSDAKRKEISSIKEFVEGENESDLKDDKDSKNESKDINELENAISEKTLKEENIEVKEKYDEFISVDNDYKDEVLSIIKKEKRITQKDLRKKIPLSEAKVSLIISELYDEKKIKKIKKGRGNILVFNEE